MTIPFINPLPGVPDVESPFFEELFSQKNASPEVLKIAQQLRDDGYAIIDFPDADFEARAERIKAKFSDTFDFDLWREELWHKGGKGLRVQDAWEDDADVKALAVNPGILELLRQLYGRRAIPFQTIDFPVGTQQEIHNDAIHFSCVPERFMCGVWVALEDVDATNGPLEFYPGTHKLPTYTNEHIGALAVNQPKMSAHYNQYLGLWQELIRKSGVEAKTFHAKKGQALIWASNLLHGGAKQTDPARTRWSQVTHYYFENCVYLTPLVSDAAFGSIFYRETVDVTTGDVQPNIYSGELVDHAVIKRSMPNPPKRHKKPQLPKDFSRKGYLRMNPDVAQARLDPAQHYLDHGRIEGRVWK